MLSPQSVKIKYPLNLQLALTQGQLQNRVWFYEESMQGSFEHEIAWDKESLAFYRKSNGNLLSFSWLETKNFRSEGDNTA